ncbi:MAG: hypothetical protein AMXMBFR64_36290 [Myxococcales bacterium]
MPPSSPFAVVLNANARKVNEQVVETLAELVSPDDIFYSASAEDSRIITGKILERGYPTVFTGGGDGTVVEFINQMLRATPDMDERPSVGILRLGTGNALAEMVSSGSYLVDIRSFVENSHRDYHPLHLVQAEGSYFPFGGLGADAELLNDYRAMKAATDGTFVAPALSSVGGYFVALFARTVPRRIGATFTGKQMEVTVRTRGRRAVLLGEGGAEERRFGAGDLLYEGPATMVMVGTCPFYGYGLKALPYADRSPDAMHLRVVQLGFPGILGNLPSLWKGTYESARILDFLVDHVELETAKPEPYQRAGDAAGYRQNLELALSQATINLIRFI